ncbi:molybdenum cofactor synthesis domain-containing protein [Tistlia consotensis]|uniref:Molybdenum cofactor synthesis domain-containing protein n=1 Tax=Tistlia consotensis USBA 355 TaxID=560819 RepID=A0A1Y6CNF8_9PROT|nr:molybdopterin-binding protein [Tistlia consotensis]SMF79822.1 molybdenum cofactor synthesis domain-containing protein [Tistlia consotensis USBA 355]SNS16652.1 molybdenum cofactor synthesis domain-containing protein [Tistlia consotensis]
MTAAEAGAPGAAGEGAGERTVTAGVVIIGNEILSGRTKDANLAFLGERLNALGVRLMEGRVVADLEAAIVEAVNTLRARYDYVFTTGGIGPTHDDITVDCVAAAFGRPVVVHPDARRLLEAHYGADINEARMRMARAPEGASLVDNPVSIAPGLKIENVYVLAGIPRIMQAQFDSLAHELVGGRPLLSRSFPVAVPESVIAPGLTALQARFSKVEMGSYPFQRGGRFGTSLVLRATDPALLDQAEAELQLLLQELRAERLPEPTAPGGAGAGAEADGETV